MSVVAQVPGQELRSSVEIQSLTVAVNDVLLIGD